MRQLPIILLFIYFLPAHSSGQINKQINIPKYKNGDTSFWYKWQYGKDVKLKLPHLANSTDLFHFRFWGNEQAADIWTNDNKLFYGLVTNYTNRYRGYDRKRARNKPYKTLYNQSLLDTSLARKAYGFIKTISAIPTEDSIKGWEQGNDGIIYTFETSTPTYYSFKTYWTPTAQDSTLREAKLILSFIKQMKDTLQLKTKFEKFFAILKPGSYIDDGIFIRTIFSARQNRRWRRHEPYRAYLDSVNDTLNSYLNHSLTKSLKASGDSLSEYTEYHIRFSTDNKVKKIITNNRDMSPSEKKDFYNECRIIKKAFKQIPIPFVHSKVKYWKSFYYLKGKVKFE